MNFLKHSGLADVHALLSPSEYHWLRYDDDKLDRVYYTKMAAKRGTDLHAFAHEAIRLRVKLPENGKTLNTYVNDGIGFGMECEVVLFGTEHCFGTADCIQYKHATSTLRIHDLKNGVTPASMDQLEIYAALFCMEYRMDPFKLTIELRIYQNDDIVIHHPDPDVIMHIIEKIKYFSRRIDTLREEA